VGICSYENFGASVRPLACSMVMPQIIAVVAQIKNGVLVEVFGFGDLGGAKLYIDCVGVLKIFDLHGTNDRSKKAL